MSNANSRQWADADDSDEDTDTAKKARSLRNNAVTNNNPETTTGESSILENIRIRASHADNTVSDGRYGRDNQDDNPSRGDRFQNDGPGSGPNNSNFRNQNQNFNQNQNQFQGRDDPYGVSTIFVLFFLLLHLYVLQSFFCHLFFIFVLILIQFFCVLSLNCVHCTYCNTDLI